VRAAKLLRGYLGRLGALPQRRLIARLQPRRR